jgi:membrane-bound lytic murein transglycosylase D
MKLNSFIAGVVLFFISFMPTTEASNLNLSDHVTSPTASDDNSTEFNEQVIKLRLRKLNSPIDIRYTDEVKSFLTKFIKQYRGQSCNLIGRSTIYFPYFDAALKDNGLSGDFKIISAIESSLNPNAVSPAGAVGFWQFMPGTARTMGLNFNSVIDERRDAYKSADAAARYLKELYSLFNDWTLTLAAYNCGPRRVQNAIDAAGGMKDFWAIRKYLPRETQNYVPKFIAMSYLFTYFSQHSMEPDLPELDLQITQLVNSNGEINLRTLSKKFDVPYEVTQVLNPAYRRGYIPASGSDMYVILPTRVIPEFKDMLRNRYLGTENNPVNIAGKFVNNTTNSSDYYVYKYTVKKGESLSDLANEFNISEYLLRLWNSLGNSTLKAGQTIQLFVHDNLVKTDIEGLELDHIKTKFHSVNTMMEDALSLSVPDLEITDAAPVEYITHTIQEGETLRDVIHSYGDQYKDQILKLNYLPNDSIRVDAGIILKIAEKKAPTAATILGQP